jgi:hypothetical protein
MIMEGHSKRLREPLSPRERRALTVAVGGLLAVVVALAAYVAIAGEPNGASGHGCVSVTFAIATGGATLHECGRAAQQWCALEAGRHGPLASAAEPQCRLAGYPFRPRNPGG